MEGRWTFESHHFLKWNHNFSNTYNCKMTDDLIDITVTIGQPKIHVGSAKFHQHGLSMSGAVS